MSYRVQVNSKVLYLPKGTTDEDGNQRHEDDLFWFVKIGDNNVSPFSSRWTFQKSGWSYLVVQEVCRHAGSCEGGMIKYGSHPNTARDLSPEEYLADYRAKAEQKHLLTVASLKSIKYGLIGFCNFKKSVIDNPDVSSALMKLGSFEKENALKAIETLKAEYDLEPDYVWAGEPTFGFRRLVEKVGDFLHWLTSSPTKPKTFLWIGDS